MKSNKMSDNKPPSWSSYKEGEIEEQLKFLNLEGKDHFIIKLEQEIKEKTAIMKKQQEDFAGKDKDKIYERDQQRIKWEIASHERMLKSYKLKLERSKAKVMIFRQYQLKIEHFTKCIYSPFQNESSH